MMLHLNKGLFSRSNINEAMDAFKKYALLRIEEDDRYWILNFNKCLYDAGITVKEFENYLIALENR